MNFGRMISGSRSEFSDSLHAASSNLKSFNGQLIVSISTVVCLSELNHDFAMFFLNNQIWQDLFAQIKQAIASYNPFINSSRELSFRLKLLSARFSSLKTFKKPINKLFFGYRNFENTSEMFGYISALFSVSQFSYPETSLTVDDSCQISKFDRVKDCRGKFITLFSIWSGNFHNILQLILTKCNRIHRERLSERTSKEDAIV